MNKPLVRTICLSCSYEKEYLLDDFGGPEQERCLLCSSPLKILNLEEIKKEKWIEGLKSKIQEVFREIGIERAIEVLEHIEDKELKSKYREALHRHFPQLKVRQDAE